MQCNVKRALCLKSCDFIFSSTIRQTLGSVYLISFYKRLYIRIGSSHSWIFCVTSSSLEEVLSELDSDSLKLLSKLFDIFNSSERWGTRFSNLNFAHNKFFTSEDISNFENITDKILFYYKYESSGCTFFNPH